MSWVRAGRRRRNDAYGLTLMPVVNGLLVALWPAQRLYLGLDQPFPTAVLGAVGGAMFLAGVVGLVAALATTDTSPGLRRWITLPLIVVAVLAFSFTTWTMSSSSSTGNQVAVFMVLPGALFLGALASYLARPARPERPRPLDVWRLERGPDGKVRRVPRESPPSR